MSDPIGALRESVLAAVAEVHPSAEVEPTMERPPKPEFGDFSTNAALLLAPIVGEKPRDVAARLEDALRSNLGSELRDVEIAGPASALVTASRSVAGADDPGAAAEQLRDLVWSASGN